MSARIGALVLLVLLVVLPGCGGGGSGGGTEPVAFFVSPPTADVIQGATQSFTATVSGTSNRAVNWTVQEAGGGSITSIGVYTAPNQNGTFHVIATSQADSTKSSTAVVTVPPVAVSLSQTAVTIDVGNQFTFVANVTGTVNTVVSWSIQEGGSGGSITGSGIYTAPGTHGTFHVIATSQADTARQVTATVTVAPLLVSIFPPSDLLGPLGVRVFSPIVNTSLSTNVTWNVQEGTAGGSVTASGQYTAPNNTGLFHVIATSVQDATKNGTANVTIVPSGFRPTGNMSDSRDAHTATLLQSGKVLMAGGDPCLFEGFYYQDCPLSSAELYDPGAGTFASTANMKVTRVFHTATLLSNGKVLVAGGHDASAELYDPTTATFAATGSMSVGRSAHTATLLANGKVLIAGGQNLSGTLATTELYDPSGGTFTATGAMAAARAWHTATLLANGNVLIAGGSNSVGDLATAELYDPTTGSFSATGSMVSKRAFQVATLLSSGNVLVTGGSAGSGLLSSAEVYDAVAGSFRATGDMIAARDSHIAVLLANGTVLVAGGSSDFAPDGSTLVPGDNSAVTAELYNPGSGTFTQTGSMVAARAFPAGVLLQDGRVLVSGGSDCLAVIVCDSSVDSAELYK
ncbi:MAG: kelch repeat-containing protein [Terriglobales bacterium]